jgi:hypothetical protein
MADPTATVGDSGWVDVPPAATPPATSDGGWIDVPAAPQSPSVPATQKSAPSALDEFKAGLAETASPANIWHGITSTFQHPIDAAAAIIQAHRDTFQRGMDAWQRGEHGEALDHFGNALFPLLGPQVDAISTESRSGHKARAAGMGVGMILPALLGKGVGSVAGRVAGAGEAAQAAATETAEAAPRLATPAETATAVAETSTPENALQNFMNARDVEAANFTKAQNLQAAKQAYQAASPSMRQTIQQQMIFQNMKEAGGDLARFGELMNDAKKVIPLEDHQVWNGAAKAAALEQLHSGQLGSALSVAQFIPGMKVPIASLKLLSKVLTMQPLRARLADMAAIPSNSPKLAATWNAIKAAAAASEKAAPAAAAVAPVGSALNREQTIYLNNPANWLGFAEGGAVERLRENTLRSLYRE